MKILSWTVFTTHSFAGFQLLYHLNLYCSTSSSCSQSSDVISAPTTASKMWSASTCSDFVGCTTCEVRLWKGGWTEVFSVLTYALFILSSSLGHVLWLRSGDYRQMFAYCTTTCSQGFPRSSPGPHFVQVRSQLFFFHWQGPAMTSLAKREAVRSRAHA